MFKGVVWICDDDDYDYGIDASVVVDGSSYATTSYSHYTCYHENPLVQTNVSGTKHEEGTEASINSTVGPPKARKQVFHHILFYAWLNDR